MVSRGGTPKGADLTAFPRSFLLANPSLAEWHNFGMGGKSTSPGSRADSGDRGGFTSVLRYGKRLAGDAVSAQHMMVTFVLAFVAAAVAGLMGALITKAAPIQ